MALDDRRERREGPDRVPRWSAARVLVLDGRGALVPLPRPHAAGARVLSRFRVDGAGGAGIGHRGRPHGRFVRDGGGGRLYRHGHGLAGHQPPGVALLAEARLPPGLPEALPGDPLVRSAWAGGEEQDGPAGGVEGDIRARLLGRELAARDLHFPIFVAPDDQLTAHDHAGLLLADALGAATGGTRGRLSDLGIDSGLEGSELRGRIRIARRQRREAELFACRAAGAREDADRAALQDAGGELGNLPRLTEPTGSPDLPADVGRRALVGAHDGDVRIQRCILEAPDALEDRWLMRERIGGEARDDQDG